MNTDAPTPPAVDPAPQAADQAKPNGKRGPKPKIKTPEEKAAAKEELNRKRREAYAEKKGNAPRKPPGPKAPKGPSRSEAILAVKLRKLIGDDLSTYRPGDRIGRLIGGANELAEVSKRPGYAVGLAGALIDGLQNATAVSRYDELLRAILPGLGPQFGLAMTPGALGIMSQLPENVVLWRVAGPKNKVGLVWSGSREGALSFAKCPAIRTREPLLIEAVVDKARVIAVWETVFGWECLALSEAGDLVSETPIR